MNPGPTVENGRRSGAKVRASSERIVGPGDARGRSMRGREPAYRSFNEQLPQLLTQGFHPSRDRPPTAAGPTRWKRWPQRGQRLLTTKIPTTAMKQLHTIAISTPASSEVM